MADDITNGAKLIAVVWAPHEARTASFAKWLNAPLYNIHYLKAKRPHLAPIKYILQWVATWWVMSRERPQFVFVTNSPPVAGLCVMCYCWISGTEFVLDTHPPGLYNRKWGWSRPLQRFTSRFARINIVDQERFRALFQSWGASAMVLENPPKDIPKVNITEAPIETNAFAYVGTFGDDEPVEILLAAARARPDITLYILGDKGLARREWIADAPPNLVFTGYLTGDAYWDRLRRSQAVIVLTTHAHSLLGGAQDGLYLGKPLILSDQPTLKEHFHKGAIFIQNSPEGIMMGLEQALREREQLEKEIQQLKDEQTRRWHTSFQQLQAILDA